MGKRKGRPNNKVAGEIKTDANFLPNPSELVSKEKMVKVTLLLTQESVDFFKKSAELHHDSYQAMIRKLIDEYATYHMTKGQGRS